MLKEKILKHDNLFMIILFLIITSLSIGLGKLQIGDELWNFSNIYKMYNGFELYKDLNVIITPLYFYIGNIIFHILGANYLSFRIYDSVIINTALFFLIYILFKKLKFKQENAMLFTIFISILWLTYMHIATYNITAIAFVVLGIIIEISDHKEIKKDLFQGILAFVIFLTKQNIGFFYIIGFLLYNIIRTENKKSKIKKMLIILATIFIFMFLYLFYLKQINILNSFISYTFGGIKEFANKNSVSDCLGTVCILFELIVEIVCLIMTYTKELKLSDIEKNNLRLIFCILIFMNLIAFPIANIAHILYISLMFIIGFICFIGKIYLEEILDENEKIKKINTILLALIFIIAILINAIINVRYYKTINKDTYYFKKESPYYGAIATEETVKEINDMCNYIKEKKSKGRDVKIISCYSDLYMNVLKRNNKEMDLPFNGNLGSDGTKGLIEEINNLKNTEILILNDDDENNKYQESEEVMSYIKENFEYKGDYNRFSIYYKNN